MRIQKFSEPMFVLALFSLAMMIGVAAAQTSTPQSNSQPQAPPPAQNAPAGAPPAAGSTGASPGAPASANQPKTIDDELQLTPEQKQKIAVVVDDENKQIDAVRQDNSLSMEQKQEKVMQIRQAGSPRIKAILTPEQLQKLAEIQQRMREQQGAGQSPAPPPPPQH
jgi:Spy/CpxP family protein refolding chaperone